MKYQDILTKDNSLVLRGLAIMTIILHNLLHTNQLGFSKENEMSFSHENMSHFFYLVDSGNINIYDLFSFLGWTGVPVFIFLTGYGTAYSNTSNIICKTEYIKKQWIKLFVLMFPAVMLFAVGDIIDTAWITLAKRFLYLTELVNIGYPWLKCSPGVYWYFSLTFQFYLLYALLGKYLTGRNLLLGAILTTIGLGFLVVADFPSALSVYRHCFTGWLPIFALGVWFGRHLNVNMVTTNHSWYVDMLIFLCSAFAVVWMNRWIITWLFVPIATLVMWGSCSLLVIRSELLTKILKWIGRLSACIFVVHPIIRAIIIRLMLKLVDNMVVIVICYVIFTLLAALLYDRIYKIMLMRCNNVKRKTVFL